MIRRKKKKKKKKKKEGKKERNRIERKRREKLVEKAKLIDRISACSVMHFLFIFIIFIYLLAPEIGLTFLTIIISLPMQGVPVGAAADAAKAAAADPKGAAAKLKGAAKAAKK